MENGEPKLYSKKEIRNIKEKYGFELSKSLGQNFLTDKNIIDKIVDGTGIGDNDLVIEIGPGIGVLTRELAKVAKKVLAIEIDKKLIPILEETLSDIENIEIINKDVLKVDINEIIRENSGFDRVRVVGNLPYYITTPIIMKLLEEQANIRSITVMMQKEVAERIKSPPGSKVYGAISVAVQYYCEVDYLFTVPKDVFYPQPKVDSAVIKLNLRDEKPLSNINEEKFWECIKKAFSQRRKTLANALVGFNGMDKSEIKELLESAAIDEMRRAETLSIIEFGQIIKEIEK